MSPAPSRRGPMKPAGKNIKKGICQNHKYYNPDTGETGDCPKCASGEVQFVNVQRLSDFKCDVCGSKLLQVKDGPSKKLIGIIAVVVVLAIAILGFSLGWFGSSSEEPAAPVQPIEAVEEPTDSVAPADTVTAAPVEEVKEAEPEKKPVSEPAKTDPSPTNNTPASKSVLGGAATLISQGGATMVKFNRSYTLDLGKSDGSTLQIAPGDVIERAQIHNNTLRGGNYRSTSGEEKYLKGLNVKL